MSTVARRAWRPLAICGACWGLLLSAGCKSNGSYQVGWRFADDAVFTPGDCGKYGVSAIAVDGASIDGTADHAVAPCAPGTFSRELPAGTWTLQLTALDAEGHIKEPAPSALLRGQPATSVVVVEDRLTVVEPPVTLPPLPQCRDGVDNDSDGRVDLDDLQCNGFILDPTAACPLREDGTPCGP